MDATIIQYFFKKSYFNIPYRRCMQRTLAWQALVMHAKVATLLTSLLFVFKISFLPNTPSHRRPGATAELVRHKPQWHRHDRRGSAVDPSLIAVAPPKTVKTVDLRGGTTETFNVFRRASAVLLQSHRRCVATAVLV